MKRILSALVFLALVGGSQALPAAKPLPPKKSSPAAQPPARLPDSEVEKDIRERFSESKINADKFTVHVRGGVATIEGHTDVIQHKGVATRMAKNAGALAVLNNVEISQAAKNRAAANLEKGRRTAQSRRASVVSQNR